MKRSHPRSVATIFLVALAVLIAVPVVLTWWQVRQKLLKTALNTALLRAAGHNREAEIKSLLAKGADPNVKGPNGYTPIMFAAFHTHVTAATIQALQKAGCDIDAVDATGDTALMHAATIGSPSETQVLVACGARVNIADGDGQTALMIAAFTGWDEVVRVLLAHGAQVNAQDGLGLTALLEAANFSSGSASALSRKFYLMRVHVVRLLVSHGADVNVKNQKGYTPLMAAASHGSVEMIEELLKAHADVNARDNNGRTALAYAIRRKREIVVHMLQQAGAKKKFHEELPQ